VKVGAEKLLRVLEATENTPALVIHRLTALEAEAAQLEAEINALRAEKLAMSHRPDAVDGQAQLLSLFSQLDQLREEERLSTRAKAQQTIRALVRQVDLYSVGCMRAEQTDSRTAKIADHSPRFYVVTFLSGRRVMITPNDCDPGRATWGYDPDTNTPGDRCELNCHT
jgi:hypothetical protein